MRLNSPNEIYSDEDEEEDEGKEVKRIERKKNKSSFYAFGGQLVNDWDA